MSTQPGRNEPCRCGSGKKYKKCCLPKKQAQAMASRSSVVTTDLARTRLRRLEGKVIDRHLLPYTENLHDNVLREALNDCLDGANNYPPHFPLDSFIEYFLIPWALFNWIPDDDLGYASFDPEHTIAENYLRHHGDRLKSDERRFIEAMLTTYYSFYAVLEVERDQSLVLEDKLLGTRHCIKEQQATRQLQRGDVIYSRLVTVDGECIAVGTAPTTLPSQYNMHLVDLKQALINLIDTDDDFPPLTPKSLRNEYAWQTHDYYFDILRQHYSESEHAVSSTPVMYNTDNEPIQVTHSTFNHTLTPEAVLQKLLPLTLPKSDEEEMAYFLDQAKRDAQGAVQQIDIPWLKVGDAQNAAQNNTVLGEISIQSRRIILKTNSTARAERGIEHIKQYLGDAVTLQHTSSESIDGKMLDAVHQAQLLLSSGKGDNEAARPSSIAGDLSNPPPEVQAHLNRMATEHWQQWFDEAVPALSDQTPREAAQTASGQERLHALLLHYERINANLPSDSPFSADIPALKRELALT